MTRLLISLIMVGMLLIFGVTTALPAEDAESKLTPYSPPLAREGDFALRLVEALALGPAADEVEAQSLLASRGVAPRNGWISNYPVTPVVMGELRESVINGSESGRLAMNRNEALTVFDSLALDMGLAVDPNAGQAYASVPPETGEVPPGEAPYAAPPVGNNYYMGDEPPIVSYYPPPYAYTSYYDWVPYPFFFTGIHFTGFFILHDFHRRDRFHHHFHNNRFGFNDRFGRRLFSNQRFDRTLGRTVRVRPANALRADGLGRALETGRIGNAGRGLVGGGGRIATSERVAPATMGNSGSGSISSRGPTVSDSSGSVLRSQRSQRVDGVVSSGRGFSGERRSFRGSDFRSGSGGSGSFRSYDSSGRGEGGGTARSFGAFRGGGGDSFRSFSSGRGGGGGDSFRSFNSGGSRGFSGRGGDGGGGRGGRR